LISRFFPGAPNALDALEH